MAIDLEKLRKINCGLGRFALYLARDLLAVAPRRFEPVLFLPAGADRHFAGHRFGRLTVRPWKKDRLRRIVRPFVQPLLPRSDIAVWHVTNQMSKYLPLDARIPVVLTIHDLNFLHEAPRRGREREIAGNLADIQRLVDRASTIVTVSRFTAEDVSRHLHVGDKPVHVVPNGMTRPPAASESRPAFMPPGAFLTAIGAALPHKNTHVLLGMLPHLPGLRLVVAGSKGTAYGRFLESEATRLGLVDRVVLPGVVTDGDRQWLYENCEAVLVPSLAEGFGFPVLEAMQCGKPVFMSPSTSLPEVAGGEGFFFESYEPRVLAQTVIAGMDRFRRDPLAPARVRSHAARFSWQEAARRYAGIYETVWSAGRGRGPGGGRTHTG